MAIVEMLKIKMIGVGADKGKVLNGLFESQLLELKTVDEIENTSIFFNDQNYNNLDQKRAKIERAINLIEDTISQNDKNFKPDNDIDISPKALEEASCKLDRIEKTLLTIDEIIDSHNDIKKERLSIENKIVQLMPYIQMKENFKDYKNTKHVVMLVGTINPVVLKDLDLFLKDCPLSFYQLGNSDGSVIKVFSHISESFIVIKKLNELGFNKANLDIDGSSESEIKKLNKKIAELDNEEKKVLGQICAFKDELAELKIVHDYLKFCMEKEDAENKFRCTQKTFVLEGYLKKEDKSKLERKLNDIKATIEFEFVEPDKNEIPPTVTRNNKIVRPFEFVTNMYSAPHYRELDPNAWIALFFSLFFGFIMADIGYGICLTLFGFIMVLKQKKNTGFKQLMNVIAIGGIFTIIFGILFGSFFGLSHDSLNLIPKAIIPDPITNVITLLVACLAAGVVQIMVSFLLKGILLIKRGHIAEAIFSAFAWDFFFIGLALFALDFAGLVNGLSMIGIIVAGSSVAVSVIGLFIINKGFNKVSKSFGALYGIINLFSDILSYARLFGLMLSGAIIASIVNQLSAGFFNSFATSIIGVIILFIGHSFNLAMGALGAYIHVARLQYIEFFSRFYEGEGELFVPFGNNFSYISLT